MADDSYSVEISSANPLPEFEEVSLKKTTITPVIMTVGTSENIGISGQIIVRGDLTERVIVPIDLHREKMIQANLLANRGTTQADTSNTHEG
jgi:hypothetical protein